MSGPGEAASGDRETDFSSPQSALDADAFSRAVPVGKPNVADRAAFHAMVDEIFDSGWLTNNGAMVQRLEKEVAEHLDVAHCIAVVNGTAGLEVALRALGMAGEVVVPSYTFVASAHAIRWIGGTPKFVDIDPKTHSIDPGRVREAMTPETTGIMATHLWGRPAEIEALQELAEERGVPLVFDAAHAFSVTHGGQMIGGFGDAEVFSFHATKFFSSFEGGAITTNDDSLAEQLRLHRNFGFETFDHVVSDGTNAKMTEICAAMGLVNLASVEDFIARNRAVYETYEAGLEGSGLSLFPYGTDERRNFQYIVAQAESLEDRDRLHDRLMRKNVMARKYFWPGCHRMPSYDDGRTWDLPMTEAVADRVLVLPGGSSVTPDEAARIAAWLCE